MSIEVKGSPGSISAEAMRRARACFFDANPEILSLIRDFDDGSLSPATFHHVDHVKLTWALLQCMPHAEAGMRIRNGLKRLAASIGKPERYHETVTVFFIEAIQARMMTAESWREFAGRCEEIIGAPGDFLKRHYNEATLSSEGARSAYVEPDAADPNLASTERPRVAEYSAATATGSIALPPSRPA